jgi:hypothetical protein
MNKQKYIKPLLSIEDLKLLSLIAGSVDVSFDEGTTNKMESKFFYFDYEEDEEDNY